MSEIGPLERYRRADDTTRVAFVAAAMALTYALGYQGGKVLAGGSLDLVALLAVAAGALATGAALFDDT